MTLDTSKPGFSFRLQFTGDKPFRIEFQSSEHELKFQKFQENSKIRSGILLYLKRLRELSRANVPDSLQGNLPSHFRRPARVLIHPSTDGILIRFDPQTEDLPDEVFIVVSEQSIGDILPILSLGFMRASGGHGASGEDPVPNPPSVGLTVADANGMVVRQMMALAPMLIQVNIQPIDPGANAPDVNGLSHFQVRSEIELGIDGVEFVGNMTEESGREFQVRKVVQLPLYWDAISIYAWTKPEVMREANFELLAERHFFETAFQTVKGEYLWLRKNSQARLREYYKAIVDEFSRLLDAGDTAEELLQQFLTRHGEVMSPGYKRFFPKVVLGAHVTDFIVEERSGEYLLVELESPKRRLFRANGHEAADLTHARGQVHDWIRYIQDNKSTVERELNLTSMSASPRALIVIGRSKNVTDRNRRMLQVGADKIEVLTYDDLLAKFVATVESFIGLLAHVGSPYEVMYFPGKDGVM